MDRVSIEWAKAFAQQALSDLKIRELLEEQCVAKCHRIHYLQMAAEKVCKASLILSNGRDYVKNKHTYTANILPIIARKQEPNLADWQKKAFEAIAREIEVAAPGAHTDRRSDNAEYPWEDGAGNIQTPCLFSFPRLNDQHKTLQLLIRLLRSEAESYLAMPGDPLN